MTTYIHKPTGITVERRDGGEIRFTGLLEVAAILFSTEAAAIHAAYLDSLGLWLDEETGCLVDTASRRPGPFWEASYSVLRRESDGCLVADEGWTSQSQPDERDQAVDRYVATLTPPQPEPQPGEVWEVTRAGKKVREVVSASGTHFLGVVDAVHDTCHVGKQGGES